jgi:hypothetical protein
MPPRMGGTALASPLPSHRCRSILVIPSSSLPLHCRRPIVVVVVIVVYVIVVVVVVAATIAVDVTFVIDAVAAAIPVVGVAAVAVAVAAVIVDIVALLKACSSYSLAVNPRNSTKASQGGITHGMLMERLPLGWP